MSRNASVAGIFVVWAVLYLPWLGTSGLRSEEGHRVLPAVEMIERGNYLVPHIAGEPYLRKPPLINWLVAASFKLTGVRNEWTARLPSVLSVLVVALAFVTLARPLLRERGSLAAALAWLTSLGMLEKGRMIEIEAVYVSLFALALLCWLVWWREARSHWLVWIGPWIFLGLGLLTKGPALLFFFYGVTLAILALSRRLSDAWQPVHIVGLLVMWVIFVAWAYPCMVALRAESVTGTWSSELLNRFTGTEGTFNDWLLNWPLALAYFLPFGLALPFVRFAQMPAAEREFARGLFWGAAVPFVVVLLLPGAIQRYVLPTLIPGCLLIGLAVKHDAFVWRVPRKIILCAMAVIALGAAIIFPLRSATVQRTRPAYDAVAAPVNAAVPPGETLYAVALGYQPYLFYITRPLHYLRSLDGLPSHGRFFVVPDEMTKAVAAARPSARLRLRTTSFRGERTALYQIEP